MYLFILYAKAPATPELGPWADLLWADSLNDLPPDRVQSEAFDFMRGILRPAGTELVCTVRGPYPMRAIPVSMVVTGAGKTTVPSWPVALWHVWERELTLTFFAVVAIEALLWFFR